MMQMLEKAVDELLFQLKSNEEYMLIDSRYMGRDGVAHVDLQPNCFSATLVMNFPSHVGTNGDKGWEIYCKPAIKFDTDE